MGELVNFLNYLLGLGGIPWFVSLSVALALLVLRRYSGRKSLSWEELYNSRIGLVPILAENAPNPMVAATLANLDAVSVVILRIWNAGRARITIEDYDTPLRFSVEHRYLLDFRVSSAKPDDMATIIEERGKVSAARQNPGGGSLHTLTRDRLRQDLPRAFPAPPEDPSTAGQGFAIGDKTSRQALTLPKLELKPGDEFKLVIDLHLLENTSEPLQQKQYEFTGQMRLPCRMVNAGQAKSRFPITAALTGLALLLAIGFGAAVVYARPAAPPGYCGGKGSVTLVGSTAFHDVAQLLASAYTDACKGASVKVEASGSLAGIREVSKAASSNELAAFSDGQATVDAGGLDNHPVAIVVFSMVLNGDVGIDRLTLAQIRDIYQGRLKDWSDVGAKMSLPIRIVSRNADSGTRQAFEKFVLQSREDATPLSSNSCMNLDRAPGAGIIRCERSQTSEVLDVVHDIPGTIGYADALDAAKRQNVVRLRLDGKEPTIDYVTNQGYPFWTIEYLYTKGVPSNESTLKKFIDYLRTDAARARMQRAGYTPCVGEDGSITSLCQIAR